MYNLKFCHGDFHPGVNAFKFSNLDPSVTSHGPMRRHRALLRPQNTQEGSNVNNFSRKLIIKLKFVIWTNFLVVNSTVVSQSQNWTELWRHVPSEVPKYPEKGQKINNFSNVDPPVMFHDGGYLHQVNIPSPSLNHLSYNKIINYTYRHGNTQTPQHIHARKHTNTPIHTRTETHKHPNTYTHGHKHTRAHKQQQKMWSKCIFSLLRFNTMLWNTLLRCPINIIHVTINKNEEIIIQTLAHLDKHH